jgi:hypothetical protein
MAFARWLLGGKCMICETTLFLQFHHRFAEEKCFEIRNCLHVSPERLIAEIAKCDLMCIVCHARWHDIATKVRTSNGTWIEEAALTF